MKRNQSQAGENSSRASQSKQSRKRVARARRISTEQPPKPAPALRRVFGSDHDDCDLFVSESDPDQFYIVDQRPTAVPPRAITRAEAVAWFTGSFVPAELAAHYPQPAPGEPALPALAPEHLDRLKAARDRLQTHNDKAQGLFYLLSSHFEMRAVINGEGGIGTCEADGAAAVGIMLLGQDVTRGLAACQDELHRLAIDLGRSALARVRLAKLDAERNGGVA